MVLQYSETKNISSAQSMAALLFLSGILLLYTAVIAPVQIFLWEFSEVECVNFPTLYFDICVDIFFLVSVQGIYLFLSILF